MKIGITCYPTYGGSGVLATELGKLLARRGHEVHFITSSLPYRLQSQYEERIFFHEVEIGHYPLFEHTPYDLALAAKMKDIFESENLDLLHVHYALPHAISAFLAARMMSPRKVPIVTTLHGTDITVVGQDKSYFDITRLGINESTIVTGVSSYLSQKAQEVFEPNKEIRTVYNFVDMDYFKRNSDLGRRPCFSRDNQVVYLHISNFRKVKRIPDVIQAFYLIQKQVDGVLVMVGEGPMVSQAKDMVKELGIKDRVKFLGKQEDVATFFSCADILLFPSEEESFGLAALEAMACKVPVIASCSGGIPEVVDDGGCGYLVAVGDVDTMAQKGIELGQSSEKRRAMGRAGRLRAEALFHPDIILPQYEDIYEEAVRLMS